MATRKMVTNKKTGETVRNNRIESVSKPTYAYGVKKYSVNSDALTSPSTRKTVKSTSYKVKPPSKSSTKKK